MARPKKYNADNLAEMLHEYIDSNDYPRIEEFCKSREMPRVSTLYKLAEESKSLSEAITRVKDAKLNYITGPDSKIHPKIAGIMLASQYNMVERQQIDTNVSGGLTIEIKLASEEK
jgi:hypothetical protein